MALMSHQYPYSQPSWCSDGLRSNILHKHVNSLSMLVFLFTVDFDQ